MIRISILICIFSAFLTLNAQNDVPRKVENTFKKEQKNVANPTWMAFGNVQKYIVFFVDNASGELVKVYNNEGDILIEGRVIPFAKMSEKAQSFLKERFIGEEGQVDANYALEKTFQTTLENQPVDAALMKFKSVQKYLVLYFDASGSLIKREILE